LEFYNDGAFGYTRFHEKGFFFVAKKYLTLAGKVTNELSTSVWLKVAERSEAKSAKREAKLRVKKSHILIFDTKLRFAQPFFA